MRHIRISAIHQKISSSYNKQLKKIEAIKIFNYKMDLSANIKEDIEENPRRYKLKHRHILTDDEIREDIDAINVINYEPKVGDKIKVKNGDETFMGEVFKADLKDFVVKTKNGEKVKLQFRSIRNGDIKVTKV